MTKMHDEMLDDLFIVDAHEDIAFHMTYYHREFVNPKIRCQITLPWLKEGSVRLVFNTVFIHPKFKPAESRNNALLQFEIYDGIYATHSDEVVQIKDAADLRGLQDGGSKIGFLTLMEGADPLDKPSDLNEFYDRGVRMVGLTWNNKNIFASGPDTGTGLTKEGHELIARMNELNITLDLSHLNERGFWQAIEKTASIPIASHSNVYALRNHPRNLKDDQIKAIAEKGGVIGVLLYAPFILKGGKKATLEDLFDHIDYMVDLVGEDHVGIGSDLDGAEIDQFPIGIDRVSDLPKIAKHLIKRGYGVERALKIMGGNFLRVMEKNLARS